VKNEERMERFGRWRERKGRGVCAFSIGCYQKINYSLYTYYITKRQS